MPQRDVRIYFEDIPDAIASIEGGLAGVTLAEYDENRQIRSAVEREFLIIGEALRQLLHLDQSWAARITDTSEIIAFRNYLAHGYFLIANETVWGIINGHLPTLKTEVAQILTELGSD